MGEIHNGWQLFAKLTPDEFDTVLGMVLRDMHDLLVAKNQSYGPANLTKFGDEGVLVRTSDKLERLIHMRQQGIDITAVGENALDAWVDIAGYALLVQVAAKLRVPETNDVTISGVTYRGEPDESADTMADRIIQEMRAAEEGIT